MCRGVILSYEEEVGRSSSLCTGVLGGGPEEREQRWKRSVMSSTGLATWHYLKRWEKPAREREPCLWWGWLRDPKRVALPLKAVSMTVGGPPGLLLCHGAMS